MAKFTFSGYTYKEGPPVTIETSMTEADFSSKKLGPSGAIMLAAFLPSASKYKNPLCPTPDIFFAIRALTSLNVSDNRIGSGGDLSGVKALAAAIPECR